MVVVMAHSIVIDGTRHEIDDVGDVIDVGAASDGPLIRVQRGVDGAVVISTAAATRDGAPMLGNLAVVAAGEGALVRAGALLVRVEWQAVARRIRAAGPAECRLCFGALAVNEPAVACGCDAPFHVECHALCETCPACGMPGGGGFVR